MEGAILVIGGLAIVIVFLVFSSTRQAPRNPRGPQGPMGPNQGPGQWPQPPGPNQDPQQRSNFQGNRGGGSGGLLQFFAIIGVLVILGVCGLLFLALQSGIR